MLFVRLHVSTGNLLVLQVLRLEKVTCLILLALELRRRDQFVLRTRAPHLSLALRLDLHVVIFSSVGIILLDVLHRVHFLPVH